MAADLKRGDLVAHTDTGAAYVVIRVDSPGAYAELYPGDVLPATIPNKDRGDWVPVGLLARREAIRRAEFYATCASTFTCDCGVDITVAGAPTATAARRYLAAIGAHRHDEL